MFRRQSMEAAELYALEHHFPLASTLIGMLMAGSIAPVVVMLLAQS